MISIKKNNNKKGNHSKKNFYQVQTPPVAFQRDSHQFPHEHQQLRDHKKRAPCPKTSTKPAEKRALGAKQSIPTLNKETGKDRENRG